MNQEAGQEGPGRPGSEPVFYIVTGEAFKQSAELIGEPIKMKA